MTKDDLKKSCELLQKHMTMPTTYNFNIMMAMQTPFTEKEIEIFSDFNIELNEDGIEKILNYCMNSGGLLKPLELTPLQIELILRKTAKN